MRKGTFAILGLIVLAVLLWLLLNQEREGGAASTETATPTVVIAERPRLEERAVPVAGVEPEPLAIAAIALEPPPAAATTAPPRSRVFGRITDTRGAPLAGVVVQIGPVGERWADAALYPDDELESLLDTTTDADGHFSFDRPVPTAEWVSLDIEPPPYFLGDGRDFGPAGGRNQPPLRSGENDLGTIALADAGAIRGTVTDDAGVVLPWAVVSVEDTYPNGRSVNGFTGEDGRFLVGGVPAGRFRISAGRQGHVAAEREGVDVRLGETSGPWDLVLPRLSAGASIAGRVVDQSGQPAVGVEVGSWTDRGGGRSSHSGSALTGADGRFELTPTLDGPFSLQIEVPGFRQLRSRTFEPGTRDIELVVDRLAPLHLRVVDAVTRAPIPRYAAGTDPDELAVADHEEGLTEFAFDSRRDDLWIFAPGYVRKLDDGTVNGPAATLLEVALQPESVATGRVIRDGEPLPHPMLVIEADELPVPAEKLANDDPYDDYGGWDVDRFAGRERRIQGDAAGNFRLDGLVPGHWRFTVYAPDAAPLVQAFVVEGSGELPLGNVVITRGGDIAGVARLPGAGSCAGLRVGLDTGPDTEDGTVVTLDASGAFRFERLTPGPHQLFVADEQGRVREGPGFPVTVVEGSVADVTLDLASRVPHQLEVEVLVNGQPVAGLRLAARPVEGMQAESIDPFMASGLRRAKTDAEGRWSGPTAGSGEVLLRVTAEAWALPIAERRVTLAAGETSRHRFDVAAGRLIALLPGDGHVTAIVERLVDDERGSAQPAPLGEGRFDLGWFVPGRYRVHVIEAGWQSGEATIAAGADSEVRFAPSDGPAER